MRAHAFYVLTIFCCLFITSFAQICCSGTTFPVGDCNCPNDNITIIDPNTSCTSNITANTITIIGTSGGLLDDNYWLQSGCSLTATQDIIIMYEETKLVIDECNLTAGRNIMIRVNSTLSDTAVTIQNSVISGYSSLHIEGYTTNFYRSIHLEGVSFNPSSIASAYIYGHSSNTSPGEEVIRIDSGAGEVFYSNFTIEVEGTPSFGINLFGNNTFIGETNIIVELPNSDVGLSLLSGHTKFEQAAVNMSINCEDGIVIQNSQFSIIDCDVDIYCNSSSQCIDIGGQNTNIVSGSDINIEGIINSGESSIDGISIELSTLDISNSFVVLQIEIISASSINDKAISFDTSTFNIEDNSTIILTGEFTTSSSGIAIELVDSSIIADSSCSVVLSGNAPDIGVKLENPEITNNNISGYSTSSTNSEVYGVYINGISGIINSTIIGETDEVTVSAFGVYFETDSPSYLDNVNVFGTINGATTGKGIFINGNFLTLQGNCEFDGYANNATLNIGVEISCHLEVDGILEVNGTATSCRGTGVSSCVGTSFPSLALIGGGSSDSIFVYGRAPNINFSELPIDSVGILLGDVTFDSIDSITMEGKGSIGIHVTTTLDANSVNIDIQGISNSDVESNNMAGGILSGPINIDSENVYINGFSESNPGIYILSQNIIFDRPSPNICYVTLNGTSNFGVDIFIDTLGSLIETNCFLTFDGFLEWEATPYTPQTIMGSGNVKLTDGANVNTLAIETDEGCELYGNFSIDIIQVTSLDEAHSILCGNFEIGQTINFSSYIVVDCFGQDSDALVVNTSNMVMEAIDGPHGAFINATGFVYINNEVFL